MLARCAAEIMVRSGGWFRLIDKNSLDLERRQAPIFRPGNEWPIASQMVMKITCLIAIKYSCKNDRMAHSGQAV